MPEDEKKSDQNIARNRKARFEYFILEKFEAGISLLGSEVKSCRNKAVSLSEAYVRPRGDELFVYGMNIAAYKQAGIRNHEETRPRKLLMHKREIEQLKETVQQKGLTLVPLSLFFNRRGIAKLEVGLAKGKKSYDKRETLKKRDAKREIHRRLS